MGVDEESATDVPPPCDLTGSCEDVDGCTCWTCELCDEAQTEDDPAMGDGPVCEECYARHVTLCEGCGYPALTEYVGNRAREALGVHDEYVYTQDGASLCSECVCNCSDCGEPYSDEDNALECCNAGGREVHDYSYRPSPLFWKGAPAVWSPRPEPSTLYVGVEIEAENAADTAGQFLEDAEEEPSDEQFVYLKRDGSLGSGGVELVTHPATPEAFLARFPFDAVRKWTERGARSYYRTSTGFHIHVSRSAFTSTHLWRFVRFQLANVDYCIRIAQRESVQWANWSGDGMDDVKKHLPAMVKGTKRNGHRYVAINFQNPNTVELRYFKGNLSPRIIRRQVLFVSAVYNYTKRMTLADIKGGAFDWGRFVDWVAADPFHAPIADDLRSVNY